MSAMIERDAYIAMVGKEVGVSPWHVMDQKRIDAFAAATEDFQFIHVDPARARQTPFGSTIAHGFLTMSMLSVFSYEALPQLADVAMGVNYGTDKVRFISPVKADSRVRGRFVLTDST